MAQDSNLPLTRREMLGGLAAMGAATVGEPALAWHNAPAVSEIARENQQAGTRDWLLTDSRIEPKSRYRSPSIEGYCSHASIRAGETISFHVSTNPVSRFTLDIYRMGYYDGNGARLIKQVGEFEGKSQPEPPLGDKRLRDCQWEACAEFRIPEEWLSGVYLGKLTALSEGLQSYIIFIVRDDRPADVLFQCSDNTWQAYNRWPNQFSLYDDGKKEWYWGANIQVGYNRPYGKYCQLIDAPLSLGSGEFLLWEFPIAYWLESEGYDVSYISNVDTHRDPKGLLRARGLLSVGHDEYWSSEMFENVRAAVAGGVNVAFLSGNTAFGKIAYDERLRSFERTGIFGPRDGTVEFEEMKGLTCGRPYANELLGAHTTGGVCGVADWTCRLPDHWLFAGTGMMAGDSIPGLVGWEWHGDPAPINGLEIVASERIEPLFGRLPGDAFTATIYPGPRNNFVFNAATIWWGDALSEPPGYVRPTLSRLKGPDDRVKQITRNLLERMKKVPIEKS